ncbi:thiamine-repressible mitochondrial transport protein THI74 [Geopyxis carbonaria]|nr:thiamine-repressible mitochondrial transport protein THI74 [Geopyxis carbonaria]
MTPLPASPRPGDAQGTSHRQRNSSSPENEHEEPLLGTPDHSDTPASNHRRREKWGIIPTSVRARHSFGMLLLGVVVVLWVSSSFLTYAIFADNSYQKPYFITYLNTSVFCLYLVPFVIRSWGQWRLRSSPPPIRRLSVDTEDGERYHPREEQEKLNTRETMRLSAEFCLLWFIANYFSSYCLAFTTVSSATVLQSTSGMFTLLIGAALRVERFTFTKLLSVVASLIGISLVSTADLSPAPMMSGNTPLEIIVGDGMALFSALAYGTYITLLKSRVGSESRVDMQLFFGFVGLFNVLCLWPGLIILHYTGTETFEMPGDRRVWAIVLVNASITLVSDYCWAYSMLLTTPLIVTLGLSLTIPLAMLGQMFFIGSIAGGWYWIGAGCVFVAFWFLNREEAEEAAEADQNS